MKETHSPSLLPRDAAIHIFDVDHTLTSHSTGRRYAAAGVRKRMFYRRELAQLPLLYMQYRMGRLSLGNVTREIRSLKGKTYEDLAALARETWEHTTQYDLLPEAVVYLQECRASGAAVILASSSFDVILEPLRDHLAVDHMICSELDYQDGVATGWFRKGPCYAQEKADRVSSYLTERGIDPSNAAFYSDSWQDLPSLLLVGHPVAVNPDILLRRKAQQEGWPIAIWRRK